MVQRSPSMALAERVAQVLPYVRAAKGEVATGRRQALDIVGQRMAGSPGAAGGVGGGARGLSTVARIAMGL